ncbi:MAG: hypothetical protein R3C39_04280 [Dehalococcoidia bacterium]
MPPGDFLRRRSRRALRVPLLLVLAGAMAFALGAVRSEAQPLDLGDENSWIRIQNVGVRAATVDLNFYTPDGTMVASDGCPGAGCEALRPGFGRSFFQQGLSGLNPGYRGSAFVTIDQPFVAMLARDVFRGSQFEIAGDSLRLGGGSSRQFVPIVQNTNAYVSRLTVQNTSDESDACFQITYYRQGSLSPVATDPSGPTAGCPNGGERVAPRGSMMRDETNLPVPIGFDGAAVVRAFDTGSGVNADAQLPSVSVDTRSRNGIGLASSRAIGRDELSRVVVLPLVSRNALENGSTWTTRFRILSGDPTAPNAVTLLFEGTDGAGGRIEIEHTVQVLGSLTCDQALNGGGGCLPPDESLPPTFSGTVRMQSIEPIAVVAQRLAAGGPLADYRGFTAEEASRQVVLPVVNKNYGPFGGNEGWNSWFSVLTFDGTTAHVRVVYYSKAFPNGLISQPVTVDRQRSFRQWEDKNLPDGWVGSAIIVSDRPVVVVANLESDVFSGDPVMMYNGVSLE